MNTGIQTKIIHERVTTKTYSMSEMQQAMILDLLSRAGIEDAAGLAEGKVEMEVTGTMEHRFKVTIKQKIGI